jgi:hypothetical protein
MAKLLYVEPNDEITDLVDRIRRAEGDRDLVFVVPPDGKVLRSPLDMRLLMQYTRGFQKRIAIVTGDPQIQALALRTGFPTFASLARLEQGAPLRGVPEAAAASVAAAAVVAAAPVVAGEDTPPTQLAKRTPSTLLAAGTGGAAGWWARVEEMWASQRGRQRLLVIGSVVVVVLLLLLLFVFPSATITLGVQAHRLADTATIQGTSGSGSGPTLDQISTEALQSQTYTQNFTVTPSGTQSLPPVPATGDLEFCWSGNPNQTLSFQGNAPEFADTTTSGVGFTTTTGGEGQTVTLPACSSGYSTGVAVQADANTVGTQGNVGSGEGWNWTNYSASGCISSGPNTCTNNDNNLHITNSAAMTGGKAATTQSVFSTSDATAATQQQQTVDTSLTRKATKQLKRLAAQDKSVIAQTTGGSGVVVTVNNPTLPTGCNTSASTPCPAASTQTLTVTLSAAATAYSPAAAKAAVLKDLKSKVPSNGELLADPDLGNPKVVSAGAGGAVTLTSHAVGYWAPQLNLKTFQAKLGFMSPGAAKTYLLGQLPGSSTVTISQSPFGLPWLPLFSGNIHLIRVSLAQRHTSG